MRRCRFIYLVWLTFAVSCGPRVVMVDGRAVPYEVAAKDIFQQGRAAIDAGDLATAESRFQEVVELYPEAPVAPDALYALAEMRFAEGGCDSARSFYQRLVAAYETSEKSPAARERLASCEGAGADPMFAQRQAFDGARSEEEKRALAETSVQKALALGAYPEAVQWRLMEYEVVSDPEAKRKIEEEVVGWIDEKLSFLEIRRLYDAFRDRSFPGEALTYKLGLIQYHIRDLSAATETFERALAEWPSGRYATDVNRMLAMIQNRGRVSPRKLGLLVPLTGRHRQFGQFALEATQIGLAHAGAEGGAVELVVKDTASDPEVARDMVAKLAIEDGVIAILGPSFRYAAEPASLEAQRLGVPLLTVSALEGITEAGPYVFRNGFTNRSQVEALVRYAMDVQGMRRFAVLYPRHPYGEELVALFWKEVLARRGEIRGIESYDTSATTFTTQVKTLVGRKDLGRRQDYRDARKACETDNEDAYRRARCVERLEKDIEPIIDFDGLFIPDYPERIPLVTAALAFEDIVVEKNERQLTRIEKTLGRKIKPVTLLGGSGWNDPNLPQRAERNTENAIFPDGFFVRADQRATQTFVDAYRKRYHRDPGLYPDALFYDSIRLLKKALDDARPTSREAMRQALRQVDGFLGVTGKTSFLKSSDAKKDVIILTIQNQVIRELDWPKDMNARPANGIDG